MTKLKVMNPVILLSILGCSASLPAESLIEDSNSMKQIDFSSPTNLSNQQIPSQSQGVSGVVLYLTGNQIPSNEAFELRSAPQPLSTKVWIFSGKIKAPGSPYWALEEAKLNPSLIGWILSDSNGRFKVGLPPGEYTILAQYDSYLYLNQFLGNGNYAPVQVTANQITEVQLVNTQNAAF